MNFWAIPYKRNPLYSDNIDMKLGPVTKLDRETKQRQKNMTMTSCWQIVMSLSLSVKLTFSLIVTFYLTKLKADLKHSSRTIALGKGTIFCQKMQIFCKKKYVSKIKRPLILKGITTYVCALTYQIPSFEHNSNKF